MRLKNFGAMVNLVTKCWLGVVQVHRHVNVLRTLPGEHENDITVFRFLKRCLDPFRIQCFQSADSAIMIPTNDHAAMIKRLPANLERVGDIRQVYLRVLP